MEDLFKWFEEAIDSGKYDEDIIVEIKSHISQDGFNIDKFMDWVSQQLEKGSGED